MSSVIPHNSSIILVVGTIGAISTSVWMIARAAHKFYIKPAESACTSDCEHDAHMVTNLLHRWVDSVLARIQHTFPNRIIIGNRQLLIEKLMKFCLCGPEHLQIIADFDFTISRFSHPTRPQNSSCHGIFAHHPEFKHTLAPRINQITAHYRPMEFDPNLAYDRKLPLMQEWWTESHRLLESERVTRQQLQDSVEAADLVLRHGAVDWMRGLRQSRVPLLIFSAGIGNVIEYVLDKHGLLAESAVGDQLRNGQTTRCAAQEEPLHDKRPENGEERRRHQLIHVVSNFMNFDRNSGHLINFSSGLLHSLNKKVSGSDQLKQNGYFEFPHGLGCDRSNLLLLGDGLHDAEMADGVEQLMQGRPVNVLRVGFMNGEKCDTSRKLYAENFDLVIENEDSFEPIKILCELFC